MRDSDAPWSELILRYFFRCLFNFAHSLFGTLGIIWALRWMGLL